jgi:3'-phosphoadenosine 5'-phosphosulfate sulfotransferase (PAPS reductase)/FAD synthetase
MQTESRAHSRCHRVAGHYKVHPIVDWRDRDVHQYLLRHKLPYHPLRDDGYLSIGDTHRPVDGACRARRNCASSASCASAACTRSHRPHADGFRRGRRHVRYCARCRGFRAESCGRSHRSP